MDSRQVEDRRSFGWPHARRWLSCVGTVAAALALSGCGWLEGERVWDDTANLEKRIASARAANQEGAGFASVRVSGRPYLGVEIEERAEARLPEDLRAEDGVTLPLGDGPSAERIAERIEEAAGVPVRFVGTASSGQGEEGKSVGCAGSRAEWLASLGDELSGNGGVWSGSLEGFLGRWTGAEGFDWRYDAANEAIEVVRSATRIFGINALLGKQEYTASTSTSGVAGEGTTATALQSVSSTLSYDPWEEIKGQVEGAAGAEATAVVSPAAGTVTVTGCPQGIERVRQYLDHLNREVLRPIILSVHMYSVKFDRASDFELGVSGFLPKVFGSNFVVGFEGGNVSVVSPSVGSRSSLQATVNAIRSVGSAQRVTSIDIPSLNGRPTQFYDLYDHGYLKEVQTVVEEGTTRISLTPGIPPAWPGDCAAREAAFTAGTLEEEALCTDWAVWRNSCKATFQTAGVTVTPFTTTTPPTSTGNPVAQTPVALPNPTIVLRPAPEQTRTANCGWAERRSRRSRRCRVCSGCCRCSGRPRR